MIFKGCYLDLIESIFKEIIHLDSLKHGKARPAVERETVGDFLRIVRLIVRSENLFNKKEGGNYLNYVCLNHSFLH